MSSASATTLVATPQNETLETQMEYEARSVTEHFKTDDGREGLAAFAAKRPPRFVGR